MEKSEGQTSGEKAINTKTKGSSVHANGNRSAPAPAVEPTSYEHLAAAEKAPNTGLRCPFPGCSHPYSWPYGPAPSPTATATAAGEGTAETPAGAGTAEGGAAPKSDAALGSDVGAGGLPPQ